MDATATTDLTERMIAFRDFIDLQIRGRTQMTPLELAEFWTRWSALTPDPDIDRKLQEAIDNIDEPGIPWDEHVARMRKQFNLPNLGKSSSDANGR